MPGFGGECQVNSMPIDHRSGEAAHVHSSMFWLAIAIRMLIKLGTNCMIDSRHQPNAKEKKEVSTKRYPAEHHLGL